MKKQNQLTDDEKVEMIKSHLFESLDVLKNLTIKQTPKKFLCDDCGEQYRTITKFKSGKGFICYKCHMKEKKLMPNNKDTCSPLDIERMKEESRLLSDVKEEPKKEIIKINILEGLTDTQIDIIKTMTKAHNLIPLGWDVEIETGDMFYMGKFICSTKPAIQRLVIPEKKTDRICIRTTQEKKDFMDKNNISPTKVFDESIKELRREMWNKEKSK